MSLRQVLIAPPERLYSSQPSSGTELQSPILKAVGLPGPDSILNLANAYSPAFKNPAFYVFTLGSVLQPAVYSRVHTVFWRDAAQTGTGLSR